MENHLNNTKIEIGKIDCDFPDCKVSDILTSTCKNCSKTFCLKHRHAVDHGCSNFSSASTKTGNHDYSSTAGGTDEKSTKTEKKPSKAPQAKKPNPKLDLMKLKLNAKGNENIRMQDRAYLSILVHNHAKPIFVNTNTQIGRLVDDLASKVGWVNQNNKLDPLDNHERISLYDLNNVILDNSQTLNDLFQSGLLYNGCTVQLKRGKDVL